MAAVLHIPPIVLTPEQAIRKHTDALGDILERLVRALENEQRKNIDLDKRMHDALDEVFDLQTKLREKDQIIEELQEMNRSRVTR